jgi:ADP-heptose:LPS heptosyltransferase
VNILTTQESVLVFDVEKSFHNEIFVFFTKYCTNISFNSKYQIFCSNLYVTKKSRMEEKVQNLEKRVNSLEKMHNIAIVGILAIGLGYLLLKK